MAGLILPGKSIMAKRARRETARFSVLSVSPMPEDHLMLRQVLDSALWKVSGLQPGIARLSAYAQAPFR